MKATNTPGKRAGCSNASWAFAEPDYGQFDKLPSFDLSSAKEGDMLMVKSSEKADAALCIGKIRSILRSGEGTPEAIYYDAIHALSDTWENVKVSRMAQATTLHANHKRFRAFKPQSKPLPPPAATVPTTNAQEIVVGHIPPLHNPSATLTALASIDSGIQQVRKEVKDSSETTEKILVALSIICDRLGELAEAWKK